MISDRPESIYEDAPEVSERCMERASRFLSYKPRTRHELIKHLTERGFGMEEASLCADRMEEYRLIDDLEYSRMYFEAMFERGKGQDRIRQALGDLADGRHRHPEDEGQKRAEQQGEKAYSHARYGKSRGRGDAERRHDGDIGKAGLYSGDCRNGREQMLGV